MNECSTCHGTVLEISPGLFQCFGLCQRHFSGSPVGPHPRLTVVATIQTLTAHEAGIETTAEEAAGLSGEMFIFANRVAAKLVNTEGLTPQMKTQVQKVQDSYRKELLEVLQGKRALADWVGRTKTTLGLHKTKILNILYESVTGLKDPELIELQEFILSALEGAGAQPGAI